MSSLEYLKNNSLIKKFPSFRNDFVNGCWKWIDGKKIDDNAAGLWRVHDKLYDLTDFIPKHPGGRAWLEISKGTDITEAFECYHLSSRPRDVLENYCVGVATQERNYRYTFDDNGFYRTLKRAIGQKMKSVDKSVEIKPKIIHNITLVAFLMSVVFVSQVQPNDYINANYIAPVIIAGLLLEWLVSMSHNFLHKADNWRMYTGNLSMAATRDMRTFHILSHHMYPNTYADLETTFFDPHFKWIPAEVKDLQYKIQSIAVHVNIHTLYFFNMLRMRIQGFFWGTAETFYWDDLVMFITPALIYTTGTQSSDIVEVIFKWLHIIIAASVFHVIGLINRGHHTTTTIHQGDEIFTYDFGEYQMNAVCDRSGANMNIFTILTLYGEQVLHQLFPSIDAAVLPQLKETLIATCKQFDIEMKKCSLIGSVVGQYKQMYRDELYIGKK
ncbi:hypothetical protein ACKWTF_006363 [Chironomus riparius]